jgi:hypothetical protein
MWLLAWNVSSKFPGALERQRPWRRVGGYPCLDLIRITSTLFRPVRSPSPLTSPSTHTLHFSETLVAMTLSITFYCLFFLSLSLAPMIITSRSSRKRWILNHFFSFFPFYFIHSQSSNIYPELWSFLFYSFQELLSPSSSCLLFEQVSILPFFFREILHLLKVWPLPPILVGGLLHIFHSTSDYRAHRIESVERRLVRHWLDRSILGRSFVVCICCAPGSFRQG